MSNVDQKSQELSRVGECLYRTGKGVYVALIKVKGKQIKRSLKTSDRSLANRRLSELREKAQRLHGAENKNIRFEELAVSWLELIASDLKPASLRRRKVAINALRPYFAGKQVRSISFSDIEGWKKERGGKVSARTHNIDLETLHQVIRHAIDKGILIGNPAEKFKRRKQPQTEVHPLTKPEFSLVVRELRSSPQSVASGATDMVEFLAFSGMRVGEAREVCRRDLDFERGTILITGGENLTKNHRQRQIPLFPNLKVIVLRILSRNPEIGATSKLFQIDSPRGAMELACKRAGLSHYNIHSLRHFFATNALESGATFKTVASWLGHLDGGMLVSKTYSHLRREFMEEAAAKLTFEVSDEPVPFIEPV